MRLSSGLSLYQLLGHSESSIFNASFLKVFLASDSSSEPFIKQMAENS